MTPLRGMRELMGPAPLCKLPSGECQCVDKGPGVDLWAPHRVRSNQDADLGFPGRFDNTTTIYGMSTAFPYEPPRLTRS